MIPFNIHNTYRMSIDMDKKTLNAADLDSVSGGVMRTVDTKMALDAVVRSGPGTQYPEAGSLVNGTQVNTTGSTSYNALDGRTWYEINYPMYGWMAGSLLGYF
jgi:uncharacterized protein YraI